MKKNSKIIIFLVIFCLLLDILLFFVLQKNKKVVIQTNSGSISKTTLSGWLAVDSQKDDSKKWLVVTVIEDKRNPDAKLGHYINNLKAQIKAVAEAQIKNLDFSDASVKEYLQKNNITTLPAIVFSTIDFDTSNDANVDWMDIKKFLTQMSSWEYFLDIWADYNPFTASDRWLPILDKSILEAIKKDSFFENGNDKKVIWLEYSDLSCAYCKAFHNSWVITEVLKKYWNEVSKAYNHYIVHDWKHFEILECMAEQKWEKWFFSLIENSFKNSAHEEAPLIAEAVKLWADKSKLEKCVLDWTYRKKVEDQTNRWLKSFNITSTPSSVFINAETWEYRVLRGYSEDNSSLPFMDSIEIVK